MAYKGEGVPMQCMNAPSNRGSSQFSLNEPLAPFLLRPKIFMNPNDAKGKASSKEKPPQGSSV